MRNRQQLGQAITDLRSAAGLSQRDLAEHLKLTRSSVANIEVGRQGVTLETLADLAAALGTTVSALLDDERDTRQPPVSVALLADVLGQQRDITKLLADLADVVHRLAEASERMEHVIGRAGLLGDLEVPTVNDEPGYDPYPGGECYCNGCIGMGPCDDELGVTDEDECYCLDDVAAAECPCGNGCWDDDFDDCSRTPRWTVTVDTGGLT